MSKKTTFAKFMREVEVEAKAEGPAAVEELEAFRDYFRLAREITEARKAKRLWQQQLANKCGLHQSEISDIERGGANPTLRTLQSLARGLDCRLTLIAAGSRARRAGASPKSYPQTHKLAASRRRRPAAKR